MKPKFDPDAYPPEPEPLSIVAEQAGLAPDTAELALMIGARFIAHGFQGYEIDHMITHYFSDQARVRSLHENDPSDASKKENI